jgi:hypothetical protein
VVTLISSASGFWIYKPEWEMAPKERLENLAHRIEVSEACGRSAVTRQWAWQKCKEDIVWWVDTFLWLFEPRARRKLEWITWDYQEKALRTIKRWFGVKDVGCEKSRDMGATWMFLAALRHEDQFGEDTSWMIMSRNATLVDVKGDPDTLFWKLDFLRENQPPFLVTPDDKIDRFEMRYVNRRNNVTINGAATTGQAGAGGRRTGIFIDEYGRYEDNESRAVNAATSANTNSRGMCSTYQGISGAFWGQMQRKDEKFVKISLPWTLHPEKMRDAQPDPRNHNGYTSPWYRGECDRLQVRALIAEEVDMNPTGSGSPFFDTEILKAHTKDYVREPYWQGSVIYDGRDLKKARLEESRHGDVLLWCGVSNGRPLPGDEYGFGADLSWGRGATPSVLSGANKRTREKVVEVARADLGPDEFAELCVAILWLFGEGYLIWEKNGPGEPFGQRIAALGYHNFYCRKDEQSLLKKTKPALVPGWQPTQQNKVMLLQDYSRCLKGGLFINRSALALTECEDYQFTPDRKVESCRTNNIDDPSGARENHGDRVVADALACKALGTEPDPQVVEPKELNPLTVYEDDPEPHSFQWLLKQWHSQKNQSQSEQWKTKQPWQKQRMEW